MNLAGLSVYPLKSCAGIAAQEWPLDGRGLQHDRSFMVVDAITGAFLTQREEPSLALVRPRISGDAVGVTTPDGSVEVPLAAEGTPREVTVWEESGTNRGRLRRDRVIV